MRVVVPFAAERPKTRLAGVLGGDERRALARAMLRDVLAAVLAAGHTPEVLATAPIDLDPIGARPAEVGRTGVDPAGDRSAAVDVSVTVDERPLTAAVNGILADPERRPRSSADRVADADPDDPDPGPGSGPGPEPIAVVMADLPLATPAALSGLFAPGADVVLAPGRGGGTNALLARHPDFRVDYHGTSYLDHRERARQVDASVAGVDSFRLATDVDERADLAEVLVHGTGRTRTWLDGAGFELRVDGSDGGGRMQVARE
ncbi:2-phospho-L-lactate guanylyltransferase [Halobacteriales archaeon QS_4_69_34]|nr:MAG: 2-phospho-L-lactate guanylyltransferase [Halobacteriales archaeon QS_4_69_34]